MFNVLVEFIHSLVLGFFMLGVLSFAYLYEINSAFLNNCNSAIIFLLFTISSAYIFGLFVVALSKFIFNFVNNKLNTNLLFGSVFSSSKYVFFAELSIASIVSFALTIPSSYFFINMICLSLAITFALVSYFLSKSEYNQQNNDPLENYVSIYPERRADDDFSSNDSREMQIFYRCSPKTNAQLTISDYYNKPTLLCTTGKSFLKINNQEQRVWSTPLALVDIKAGDKVQVENAADYPFEFMIIDNN